MQRFRQPSIRVLVALIVVLPILAASAALVGVSAVTSRRIAEDLGTEVVETATERVNGEVRAYLGGAVRVSELYARRVRDGVLPAAGLQPWERMLLDDLTTSSDVASICFANPQGAATWLLRAHQRLEVGRATGPEEGQTREFVIDANGTINSEPLRTYKYDARARLWYKAALENEKPLWTPVYFWFGDQGGDAETGAGYTRAMRGADGQLLGVLVIDVTLGALSEFLRGLPLAHEGFIFIVDDQNRLVAASQGKVNSNAGARLALEQSESAAARAVAAALAAQNSAAGHASNKRVLPMLRLVVDGQPARAKVTHLKPYPGINWQVIAVIPEATFLAEAEAVQNRSILMALVAVIGSVFLGIRLSRQITQPVLKVTQHVQRVGGGDFETRLELRAAKELAELSRELNRMSGDLKQRMELQQSLAVAMQVQQSLLPEGDPAPPRLEIAGRSRYCDSTGGDYYDFIDVSHPDAQATLIAVGDVMGHGIAAALLMASARAALRAHAFQEGRLAKLMNNVNRVLASDARHKRFMTMALVIIHPEAGTVRWASAGHDAPIVYHPHSDQFEELEGGDMPLGMFEGVEYEEYQRGNLQSGALLLIGTDGIWEMADAQGELFGKDRLREFLRAHHQQPAAKFAELLEAQLTAFRGPAAVQDDVTFVVVKIK